VSALYRNSPALRLTRNPELYLRRPPSQNEKYRLDRMLFAAAERGVKVNIIVYKEVASVLTCD
jgi:phospholipase D1/2